MYLYTMYVYYYDILTIYVCTCVISIRCRELISLCIFFLRQISCNDDNVISDTQHSDIVVECLVIPLIYTRMYRYEWKYLNTNPDGLLQCQSMYGSMYRSMYPSMYRSMYHTHELVTNSFVLIYTWAYHW